MIVIYEKFINEDNIEDERNLFDCDTLKEMKIFLEKKCNTKTSLANLSKIIRNNGTISKKYKIYKIKI